MTQKATVPVAYASEKQLHNLMRDPDDESGTYIPLRRTARGLFQMPLYTAPSEAIEKCARLVENWTGSIPARQVLLEMIREIATTSEVEALAASTIRHLEDFIARVDAPNSVLITKELAEHLIQLLERDE